MSRARICVRVDKSAEGGVVISALEVIEAGLFIRVVAVGAKKRDKLAVQAAALWKLKRCRKQVVFPGRAEALPGVGSVEYGGAEQHDLRRKQIPAHLLREGKRFPFTKGGRRGRGGRIRFLTASRSLHRPALRGGLFAVQTIP